MGGIELWVKQFLSSEQLIHITCKARLCFNGETFCQGRHTIGKYFGDMKRRVAPSCLSIENRRVLTFMKWHRIACMYAGMLYKCCLGGNRKCVTTWQLKGYQKSLNILVLIITVTLSETIVIIRSNSRTRSGKAGLLSANSLQQFNISWYLGWSNCNKMRHQLLYKQVTQWGEMWRWRPYSEITQHSHYHYILPARSLSCPTYYFASCFQREKRFKVYFTS